MSLSEPLPDLGLRLVAFRPEMTGWWAEGPAVFEARTGLEVGEAAPWIWKVLARTRAPEFEGPGGGWHGFWAVEGRQWLAPARMQAAWMARDGWRWPTSRFRLSSAGDMGEPWLPWCVRPARRG